MTDDSPDIERYVTQTHKWTFQVTTIRDIVERHLEGETLNLFAGKTKLNHSDRITRNDINTDLDTDYHFEAKDALEYFDPNSFDTVILDPPFSIRNSILKYDGEHVGRWGLVADAVNELVRPGGIVISFGHNSTGLGKTRGYRKEKLFIFNHKGGHHDTMCLIERQVNNELSNYD